MTDPYTPVSRRSSESAPVAEPEPTVDAPADDTPEAVDPEAEEDLGRALAALDESRSDA